ncbi:MAG TPA: CBS domain-containing protein [Rhodopila sp.]|uniref:CBS domain-containing protein n=1 Tax=Rhodopila sp. TaxID=2480087 RepID=UPI002CBE16FF|nr:CBS domain-containing protein [Rhodopila sp.]HVY13591.1 CBS domain-containing protein [Rhodopila sp.]
MNVSDVMTRNVISVGPDDTVEQAVKTMLERRISGLLVVDKGGNLAGVVTEGDLLRRDEIGTETDRPWWLRLLVSPSRQAADFVRANGRYVKDIMTTDVLTVAHDAPLEDVVSTMEKNRIKRLPVTRDGRVVGIVSRADLLRALIGRVRDVAPTGGDDRSIRDAIMNTLSEKSWAPRTTVNVTVNRGVADIWGSITNENERAAIRVAVENTPGVTTIHDHLVYIEPYTGTVIESPDDTA